MDHSAGHQQTPLLLLEEQILCIDPTLMMSVGYTQPLPVVFV